MKNSFLRAMAESDKMVFFTFFPCLFFIGSALLYLPFSYGDPREFDLSYIDALFTSVSAVCVTGLITVDTGNYTAFGQWVVLFLIQLGGLGIISLSTLYLASPGKKISLKSRKIIRGYYIEKIEHEPLAIIRNIVLMTLFIEVTGALLLFFWFRTENIDRPLFTAVFHAVSAFCNAGFSLFSTSLETFRDNPYILGTIMMLIILGGLSFIVIHEVVASIRRPGKTVRLSFHSRAVLCTTLFLIILGTAFFYLLEPGISFLSALFQSVTPRTAGFNSITQAALSDSSKLGTMFLMLVGGAPGSIAGGIKVTTLFLLLVLLFRRPLEDGSIQVWKRNISGELVSNAAVFLVKALSLVFFSILALTITENLTASIAGTQAFVPSFLELVFESVSAFGTVGLSLGVTPLLSSPGKIVVIIIMFAGRIGLITMAMPVGKNIVESYIRYPGGEVMIG